MKSIAVRASLLSTAAQAPAELLEEHDRRLGRAQHQHRVDLRNVEAFVEHVDRADDLQLTGAQPLHRADARRARGAAVHGNRRDPVATEELGREVGVGDRDAERDGATAALVAPDVESVLGTFLRLDGLSQHRQVEPAAAPGDRRVVDVVGDPEVAKRAKVAALDALGERALVNQVVRAQRQQVRAVHAVGGRGKSEEECRLKVIDHPAVTAGGGVMELIDYDVVEPVGREPVQIPGERLDAGEQHAGVRLLLPAVVQAEVRIRLDAAEHVEGLAQNLLAVGDEQHPAELRPGGVERGEPRLAQASRHHDQAAAEALQPGLLQGR